MKVCRVDSFYSRLNYFSLHPHRKVEQVQSPAPEAAHRTSAGLRPSSLELGDLERRRAGKVQEKGSFLFGQEGGGGDIVDACWDVVHLHVTEPTPGKAASEEEESGKNTGKNECLLEVNVEFLFICCYFTVLQYF